MPESTIASQFDRGAKSTQRRAPSKHGDRLAPRTCTKHPELGNRGFVTSASLADHLRRLGLDEVRTEVAPPASWACSRVHCQARWSLCARYGRTAGDRGSRRPVRIQVQTTWKRRIRRRMHACGHDTHTAILMVCGRDSGGIEGETARLGEVHLPTGRRNCRRGRGRGAKMMIDQGALENPKPKVIFGLHVTSRLRSCNRLSLGPTMASADRLRIPIEGRQTHGAMPVAWCRSHRHRRTGGARVADRRQPSGRHHQGTGRRHDRHDQRAACARTSSRIRSDARHDPHFPMKRCRDDGMSA